jgi:hypothetical protein
VNTYSSVSIYGAPEQFAGRTYDSYQGTPSGVPYKAEKLNGFSRGAGGSTLRVAGRFLLMNSSRLQPSG